MIKFVDLGSQVSADEETPRFAWWDTVINSFMDFSGVWAFESWDEFEEALIADEYSQDFLDRFKALYPKERKGEKYSG